MNTIKDDKQRQAAIARIVKAMNEPEDVEGWYSPCANYEIFGWNGCMAPTTRAAFRASYGASVADIVSFARKGAC